MADISKITLPNGNTYDIKDIIARERGLPAGGDAGQVLSKIDGTDYNTEWIDPPSGGGGTGYKKTILWSGYKDDTGTITLNDSVENYDIVLIKFTSHPNQPTTQYYEFYFTVLPNEIVYNQSAQYCLLAIRATAHYGDGSIDCYFSNSTSFVIETISIDAGARLTKPAVLEIIGLNFSSIETAFIYSTEERVVGVWTDNRPLYQKTLNLTSPSVVLQGAEIADLTSLNIGTLVKVEGFLYSATYSHTLPIYWSWVVDSSELLNSNFGSVYYDNGHLKQNISSTAYTQCPVTITIQYTKTTDTPGSGHYVTSGAYAHHYSTNEQVVGTWIDGSTLYEKTYTYSFTASSNDYDHTIATLSSEINPQSIETNAFRRDGILFKELIYPPGDIYCRYAIDNNVLSARVFNSSGSTFEGTVTIRYTKTS